MTVLMTHIGFEEDKKLAAILKPEWGVDLIIGGHSHTWMSEPTVINGIPIAQAHMGTDDIGRFDIVIDTDKNSIASYEWSLVPINEETAKRDPQIEALVHHHKSETDQKYERVIGHLRKELFHPFRNKETALGNLIADIFQESLGVDIMLLGSGSLRSASLGPLVTYRNLIECYPYDGEIYMIKVSGRQLYRMICYMQREEAFSAHTEYYRFSKGMKVVYSRVQRRIESFRLNNEEVLEDDSRYYTVGLQLFHFLNFEKSFSIGLSKIEKNMKPRIIAGSGINILEEYFLSHPNFPQGWKDAIL